MEEDKLKIDMDNIEMFWVWKDENGNEKKNAIKTDKFRNYNCKGK